MTTWTVTRGCDRTTITIKTASRLVISRGATEGAGYASGHLRRDETRFPRLLAWRKGRNLKAQGYRRST